ncbi:MAG: PspC domain-containing protein [Ignavibacteria bacterium]|jgi:phage shock protein C|nr:PspC domain-containing protein [Ignavibacteria bacterium]MDH7528224.1 PspC domain-containing protein [Ignavibacteria bacterium]
MNKKLYRSRQNKIIGGVCGGIGKYFDIDPVLIRLLFVLITLFNGAGLILYIILLIILPLEPFNPDEFEIKDFTEIPDEKLANTPSDFNDRKEKTKKIFGIILLIIGTLLFLENFINILDFEIIAPLIMILIGLYLIYDSIKKQGIKNEN